MHHDGGAEFIRVPYKYSRPLPKILHVIVLMYQKSDRIACHFIPFEPFASR